MSSEPPDEVIASTLDLVRETLGMDAAHLGTFAHGDQEIREISGPASRFGLRRGTRVPVHETFCQLMLDGQIPQVVPDTAAEPALAEVPAARDRIIGAYVGVPVTSPDGAALGSLCAISASAEPQLSHRDIAFMRILGQLVGDRLQRQEMELRERERLEALVAARTEELVHAQAETALRLSRAVEFRDDKTGNHIDRVGIMAEMLARAAGQDAEYCRLIRLAAPLHDVGKVAAPDHVLLKPGGLTEPERQLIQRHPEIGHEMLADSSSDLLQMAAAIARTHHERIDGGGYSQHLRDGEIPLEGRIVAIADVFDALSHDRIYRPALPVAEAVSIMRGDQGHFDPELLELFIAEVIPALPFGLPHAASGTRPAA